MVLNQTLAVDDLVAFFLYLELFYQPFDPLSGAWESIQESLAGAERVAELLQEEPDIVERSAPSGCPASPGRDSLRDVGFATF